MLKKQILHLLSITCLLALSVNSLAAKQPPMTEKLFNAYDFDSIIADGYFKLEISEQKKAKPALLTTSSYPDHPFRITVHDHTLYIMSDYQYLQDKPQPKIIIQLKDLKQLIVYGPTEVSSKHLPTQELKLVAQGYGNIKLDAIGKLNSLEQKGNNVVDIKGIDTQTLEFHSSGFGQTTLQGKAQKLYARLDGGTTLKARNLAVDNINIQTTNNSQAYVHPLKSLRAFASQASTIYYYKQINDLTSQPIQSGNVLQMGW